MSMLEGFKPMKVKRTWQKSKWNAAGMVAEFIATGETCLGKEYQDEDELKHIRNSLYHYLTSGAGRELGVSVHKRGNTLILLKHKYRYVDGVGRVVNE